MYNTRTYLIILKNRTFARAARAEAQPCSPPYAQHGTLQPATGHTVRHSLPPLQPSSAFSLRGPSLVGTSQLSRNIANTRLTQQHQLQSESRRRACFMRRINSMKTAIILICGTDLDIHIMSDSSLILNLSIYKSKYK